MASKKKPKKDKSKRAVFERILKTHGDDFPLKTDMKIDAAIYKMHGTTEKKVGRAKKVKK